MKKLSQKELDALGNQVARKTGRGDTIKTDENGRITNWNELSEATRKWLEEN